MGNSLVETIVLSIVFGLCVLYIVRKAMAKFAKFSSPDCASGCSGCRMAQDKPTCNPSGKKTLE
jgi:hypothetical protein